MPGSNLYMKDTRSAEEIKKQSEAINEVTKANMQLFRTKLEEVPINKEKQNLLDVYRKMNAIELETVKLETMYFDDNELEGAYCQYSVHIPENNLRFAYPVLTISGVPSYIHEWNYLAENSQAIWINFLEPGLEILTEEQEQNNKNGIIGANERRGKKFNGSIQDTVKMIVKLLDKLGYGKVILMCHSFGFWVFTALQKLCPDRIAAAAELGAFGITAHEMAEHNYGVFIDFIKEQGLDSFLRELDGSDEDRLKLLDYACRKSPYYKNVLKALNMHTSIFAVQKILETLPGGLSAYKEFAREEGIGFLTFLAGGKNDVVTKQATLEECYYHYYEKSQVKVNSEQDKEFLQNYVKSEIVYNGGDKDLDVENLEKNFIFLFENTGHSVHQIRGKELLAPLRVFFRTVEGLQLIKEVRGCQSKL